MALREIDGARASEFGSYAATVDAHFFNTIEMGNNNSIKQ